MGQPQWQLGESGSGAMGRVRGVGGTVGGCSQLPLSLDPLLCLLPWQLHGEWGHGANTG